MNPNQTPVALVTGGSAGLGRALVTMLSELGWSVVTDGRDEALLHSNLVGLPGVTAIAGDVSDARHREQLVAAVRHWGRLDVLINNASTLGPLPLRELQHLDAADLSHIWAVNVIAPYELNRLLLSTLRESNGLIVSISSDAAVEHYQTWGGYGASKATLDHLTLTFGAETGIPSYAVDPGEMATALYASAVPDADLSEMPLPTTVAPRLLSLIETRPPSGRYRAVDLQLARVSA